MLPYRTATLLAALSLALAPAARAQWTANGVGIATGAPIEFNPAACSDGANGAFVAWVDGRNGVNSDLYLQRLDGDGSPAPGWPAGGIGLCTQAEAQAFPVLAAEPAGGCWVAWSDYRDGGIDVFVARVLADGSLAPGWPAGGRPVAGGVRVRTEPTILADGAGGAYVAWTEYVSGLRRDLRLARLGADGLPAPGWPDTGLVLSDGTDANVAAALCADGAGGVFACWQELGTGANLRLRRVAGDASFPAGWAAPQSVFPATASVASAGVIAAPAGGAYVVAGLSAGGPTGLDVWAHRIAADGAAAAGWPAEGIALCTAANAQQHVRAIADGAGGVVVAWADYRAGATARLYATRFDGGGATGAWPADGDALVSLVVRGAPALALDGLGNVIAFAEVAAGADSDLRGAARTLAGAAVPGWGGDGNLACDAPGVQTEPIAVPSSAGTAIVVWTDFRNGSQQDVYAAKLASDGSVPALATFVRASASPGCVALEWHLAGETARVTVERAADGTAWAALGGTFADGAGLVRWLDEDVVAGRGYAYRLRLAAGRTVGETRVLVPLAAGFALEAPWPNPARGGWSAAFALGASGPATLALLDAAGRVVAARDATLGAGRHVLAFDASGLRPGVYFVRLEQGGRREVRRLSVAR